MFRLEKPSLELENAYIDYITEWEESGEEIVPFASKRNGLDYKELLYRWEVLSTDRAYDHGFVPSSLYFLVDENNRIYGAIHIRRVLNESLLKNGGHIGYGIRPSERKKGYVTLMLSSALPIAKSLGIHRVLVTCDKNNLASARTIMKNGGVLENEIRDGDEAIQRYWINL